MSPIHQSNSLVAANWQHAGVVPQKQLNVEHGPEYFSRYDSIRGWFVIGFRRSSQLKRRLGNGNDNDNNAG